MTSKKGKAAPSVPRILDPIRGCQFCGGTGWIRELHGQIISREVPGLSKEVEGLPPVRRCRCTSPAARGMEAPAPPPAGIDQAQRAAGEKEEA